MARDRVLPTSLITLHILAVTVVLCSTFIAVFAEVGAPCSQDSGCTTPNETCAGTECACAANYYNASNSCVQKTAHGQPCNSDDQCLVGSCSDTDKCLCGPNQYYHSTSISCNSIDDLKVTAVTATSRNTNSVELTLTAEAHGTNVKYMVKPNDDASLTKNFTGTEFTVSDLTSGTEYTFTVTPVLPADTNYPEKTAGFEMSSPVWTKPAKPGAVNNNIKLVSDVNDQLVRYEITFEASQGKVSHYTMTIDSTTVPSTGNATTVTFTNLQPGKTYSYSITAYNGNDDASATSTDTLNTPVTKVAHGDECDDNGYVCQASDQTCTDDKSSVKRCLCGNDYFFSTKCETLTKLNVNVTGFTSVTTDTVALTWTADKHGATVKYEIMANPGEKPGTASQTGGSVSGLSNGTQYTFNITSVLQADDTYYNGKRTSVLSQPVWTKIPYAQICTPSTQPECEDGNIACRTTSVSSDHRCLCQPDYYRNATNTVCNPLIDLKVITVQGNQRSTNSVNLTLNASTYDSNVKYMVQPSGDQSPVTDFTGKTGTVSGLTAGTNYTFTVTPFLPSADYYPELTVTPTTSGGVWTMPAKPGNVTKVVAVNGGHEIRFGPSDGNVAHYKISVHGEVKSSQGASLKINVISLQPAHSYSYTLVAVNGKGDESEAVTDTLETPVEASKEVSDLEPRDVNKASANITWKKPMTPNGNITGYTITVLDDDDDSTCIYGYIIGCSNCSPPGKSGDISQCENKDGKNLSSSAVNNTATTFNVYLEDLKPYHNYTVWVTADNTAGIGMADSVKLRTLEDAARDVTNVTATSARNSDMGPVSLTVKWTPGYFTGPTQYLVTLKEEDGIDLGTFTKTYERIVEGYNNIETTWTNVRAYWNYQVSVLAMTNAGNSSSAVGSMPSTVQTVTTVPGPPESVSVKQNDTVAQELALTVTCPDKEKRNGRITGYVIRKTLLNAEGEMDSEHAVDVDLSKTCEETYTAKDVGGIKVEHNYTFAVKVSNTDYNSTYKTGDILVVEPKVPRFEEILESYKVPLVKEQSGSTSSETEIDVSVCASCLLDGRQGTVTKVGLVVCKVGPDDQCIDGGRKKRSGVQFEDYTTWKSSHDQNFKYIYRTTPDDWMSTLTSPNTSYPYKIGTDANCRTSADTEYCNGPLPADTVFRVTVIQCNSEGCVIGTFEGPFRTGAEEEPTPVGAIVGGVVAVLVAAAVVAGVAFFLLRRRRGRPTRTSNPIWDIDNQSKQNVPPPVSRPIRIRDFKDEVTKMHKDCNLMFQDQFEDIKKLSAELNATTNEAQREGNRVKNRYVDILPYDHSRVKLSTTPDDDETMDFINANYIAGYSSVREYIATQGPMHCTIPDFWRMAWEQNCRVIVMLSDLQENGKRKVGLYWPENLNDPINYGTVVVEMTNFSQLNKYIIRNFVVKKGNETRKMTHFFLPGWWDFSANLTFDDVLEFAKLVRQEATPHTDGPIIVHCSAGVGRTGTLIALDYFMQFIDKHSLDDTIDVYKFVLEMRKNRPRMVQAETQYIFIFDALVEVIQNKIKAEEERLYDNCSQGNNIYANVGNKQEENIYANTGKDAYVYNNEAFEPEYQNMEMKSQDKTEKPTTEL